MFGRNVQDAAQLRRLVQDVRSAAAIPTRLLVDQEGGRVARLRPPHWRAHPPAGRIGKLAVSDPEAARRAAWLTGALIGLDCGEVGIDVVCAPVLDLLVKGATVAIGDRAYSVEPFLVTILGRAMACGLLAAGIEPVMKHLPGHGRATSDSHQELPVVTHGLELDLVPFHRNANLPWAMTAHILYPALDPDCPATLSPGIIQDVIRRQIGFGGVLVSDDLAMSALEGAPAGRASSALAAGCDLAMYCAGDLAGSRAVLEAAGPVSAATTARLDEAAGLAQRSRQALDAEKLLIEREALLA